MPISRRWLDSDSSFGDFTHDAAQPLSDITGGDWSDYMQEPQKALLCIFNIRNCAPQDILMCKIGGFTL